MDPDIAKTLNLLRVAPPQWLFHPRLSLLDAFVRCYDMDPATVTALEYDDAFVVLVHPEAGGYYTATVMGPDVHGTWAEGDDPDDADRPEMMRQLGLLNTKTKPQPTLLGLVNGYANMAASVEPESREPAPSSWLTVTRALVEHWRAIEDAAGTPEQTREFMLELGLNDHARRCVEVSLLG